MESKSLLPRECDDLLLALKFYEQNTDYRTRVLHYKRIDALRKRLVDIAYGPK